MKRRTIATIVLAVFAVAAPVLAADREAPAGSRDAAIVAAPSDPQAGGTDWSMNPVTFGPPTRGHLLPALYVSLAGLNAFDAYSTSKGLSRGASESNSVLKAVAGNQAGLWAVKSGVTASSIFFAERLWRGHHKPQAIAVMIVTNGMMAAVSARNASVLRQQQ